MHHADCSSDPILFTDFMSYHLDPLEIAEDWLVVHPCSNVRWDVRVESNEQDEENRQLYLASSAGAGFPP